MAVILASSVALSSPGSVIDDATITTKVAAALVGNPATKAYQIDVDTKNGVVQLNGFVDSSSAKSEAEKSTRTVEGVKFVDNNLEIRDGSHSVGSVIDDSAITAKVKTALIVDSRTKAYQIEVTTFKGIVSLGGFVSTEAEKQAAGEVAMHVEGVVKVDNGIKVGRN